jgi:hypothetical protein
MVSIKRCNVSIKLLISINGVIREEYLVTASKIKGQGRAPSRRGTLNHGQALIELGGTNFHQDLKIKQSKQTTSTRPEQYYTCIEMTTVAKWTLWMSLMRRRISFSVAPTVKQTYSLQISRYPPHTSSLSVAFRVSLDLRYRLLTAMLCT